MPKQKTNDQQWRSRGKMKLKMRETEEFRVRGKNDKKTWIREEEKDWHQFSSIQPHSQVHGLQHARLPCLSPTPGACSNSCPLSQWCHPIISSCVFSCPQSFPGSGSFLMSRLFISGGRSNGASILASVLQMNIQGWFPGFPDGSDGKESACNVGDPCLIPRSGWSPGEGNVYPL